MAESAAKILLVDPPSVSPNELNLGLASIAGVLRARGHAVRVLDLNNLNVPGGRARRLGRIPRPARCCGAKSSVL